MNQLTEQTLFEQQKSQLKNNIERQINDSKSVIDQEFHKLKVSISQQIDNFNDHFIHARRIFSESPQSDQTMMLDFDLNDAPLNLSNKCKEEQITQPIIESALDLTASQQTRASNSANSIQSPQNVSQRKQSTSSVLVSQPPQNVSQKKPNTSSVSVPQPTQNVDQRNQSTSVTVSQPPQSVSHKKQSTSLVSASQPPQNVNQSKQSTSSVSVSQPRQISSAEHTLLHSATSVVKTINKSADIQQQILPAKTTIKTEIDGDSTTSESQQLSQQPCIPAQEPQISKKRELPDDSTSSSAKRALTRQNSQSISDNTLLMNETNSESSIPEKSKLRLNDVVSKNRKSVLTSSPSKSSTSSDLPITKLCSSTSNQTESHLVSCQQKKPKIDENKVRKDDKLTCSDLSEESKAKNDNTGTSSTKISSSAKPNNFTKEKPRSRSRSHSRTRARSPSQSSEEYSNHSRNVYSRDFSKQISSFSKNREKDNVSIPFFSSASYHKFIVKSLACPKTNCKMEFSERNELDKHIRDRHVTQPNMCLQAKCGMFFETRKLMTSHLYHEHAKFEPLICAKCLKLFKNAASLSSHFNFEHVRGNYICSVRGCNFRADYSHDVMVHFPAEHCTKDGSLKKGLVILPTDAEKLHRAVPSEERGWRFRENYTKLYNVTLSSSKDKFLINTLFCRFKNCDFVCTYKGDFVEYEKHCSDIHKTKWYLCLAPNCGESFYTRSEFEAHLKRNHVKNNWQCSQCPFRASDGVNLHDHEILYHCKGIFSCSFNGCIFEDNFRIGVIDHYYRKHGDHH